MVATFTTIQGPRGRPFEKGMTKIGGRKKGALNIHSRTVRMAIAEAARGLGGVRRLIAWAKEDPLNERAFWTSIWPRLLPLEIQGAGDRGEIELNVTIKPEELDKALEERGLPATIFGIDVPTVDIEPQRRIEANGNGSESEDLTSMMESMNPEED
jgi:hypothetical protein